MINTREIAKDYRLTHWAQIIQERGQRGVSIRDYCTQIEISENTYYYWQRRVRLAACEMLAEAQNEPAPVFAEVQMVESPALPPAREKENLSQLRVEILGMQITADPTYPPSKLAALLRELVRPC